MRTSLIFSLLLISAPLAAQVLTLPQAPAGDEEPPAAVDRTSLPQRGTSMDTVRARYGEPLQASAPIGEPPITRWNYEDFSVFFEYDHAINTIVRNRPAPIYNQDELRAVPR